MLAQRTHEQSNLPAITLDELESKMLDMPHGKIEVFHRFGVGVYIREFHAPAGHYIITHAHKFAHNNVFLSGRIFLAQENGSIADLSAPMSFVASAGRKFCYVVEDVVWQNIYATDETDIEKLEAMFFDKTDYSESHKSENVFRMIGEKCEDREDYSCLDKAISGYEDKVFSNEVVTAMPFGQWRVKAEKSPIHGKGVFATADIGVGELVMPFTLYGIKVPCSRYLNHSKTPTAELVDVGGGNIHLFARRDINGMGGDLTGEEITIDYRTLEGILS